MTRRQAEKLSGRLAVVNPGPWCVPRAYTGEPAVILGCGRDLALVGWVDPAMGWTGPTDDECASLFGDEQGCASFWYTRWRDLDLLPIGAAVARKPRRRK
jgi:hypothetical protein